MTPAEMQQAQLDRMKTTLGVPDDEWKAIEPKLAKVMDAQRQSRIGGMGGMMGGRVRGGMGGPGAGAPARGSGAPATPAADQTDLDKKVADLQTTLQNPEAKPEDIKPKLAAVREARDKARADLVKAQKELRDILTVRLEAQFVLSGQLD